MSAIKVEFQTPIQEFEIGGKIYELAYDDENIVRLQKICREYQKKVADIKGKNLPEEQAEQEYLKILTELIDSFFYKGSFDEIYKASRKSIFNMAKVVKALFDWSQKKSLEVKQQQKEYYINQ